MQYKEKYPQLYQFLGGYFPDADLFDLSDEEVTINYKAEARPESVSEVIKELEALVSDPPSWQTAAEDANRYFEHPDDIVDWLRGIRRILASENRL
ncbi:contact-dependent growth inhibition system immunity protein [Hymenobacter fodinae]|uniref:CdiI immunity protein domain-containing protein n=1 Tax=Hymenobacter fodinae TaxID=2510796 RepID=A0A4Z0PAE1_9BACT|nr:contact-dependent growth inhibition system immunity protein [Hymenobacter fodinae]TGE09616.1 hypothetical protein EU556_01925 [Hymenobacter fodinae]